LSEAPNGRDGMVILPRGKGDKFKPYVDFTPIDDRRLGYLSRWWSKELLESHGK